MFKNFHKFNLYLVTFLLVWQLVHLYWLATNVIALRLFRHELWQVGSLGDVLIAFVDYTEIPALLLGSVFYITELRREFRWYYIWLLIFLNSQWLHLFWITDEVVVAELSGMAMVGMPAWLSWLAIFLDYLELPVIYDTVKKTIVSFRKTP